MDVMVSSCSSCSIIVYRRGRVEPASLWALTGLLTVPFATNEAYAIRQVRLDGSDDLVLGRSTHPAMCIDQGLGNVADLHMAVLGQADKQGPSAIGTHTEPLSQQSCRHTDELAARQRLFELGDLGLQLSDPSAGLQTVEDCRRRTRQANLCLLRLLDHVTSMAFRSADTGRRSMRKATASVVARGKRRSRKGRSIGSIKGTAP